MIDKNNSIVMCTSVVVIAIFIIVSCIFNEHKNDIIYQLRKENRDLKTDIKFLELDNRYKDAQYEICKLNKL